MKPLVSLFTVLFLTPAMAQDHADIDRSQIIGNRELPKVLYIVPWKKPLPGDLSGRPLESVLDEALAPVDKEVFQRQVKYQTQPYQTEPIEESQQQTNKQENKQDNKQGNRQGNAQLQSTTNSVSTTSVK